MPNLFRRIYDAQQWIALRVYLKVSYISLFEGRIFCCYTVLITQCFPSQLLGGINLNHCLHSPLDPAIICIGLLLLLLLIFTRYLYFKRTQVLTMFTFYSHSELNRRRGKHPLKCLIFYIFISQ